MTIRESDKYIYLSLLLILIIIIEDYTEHKMGIKLWNLQIDVKSVVSDEVGWWKIYNDLIRAEGGLIETWLSLSPLLPLPLALSAELVSQTAN